MDTLQRGVPTELAQGPDATDAEYIIALCLTAALEGQRFTGIPHLKALLLLGVAEGRKEEKLLETLGDGVHKARLRGSWGQIMPRALPANATIAIVLAHCHAHAIALLNAPGERAKPEVKWLQALVRWCELLQQTKRVTARRVPPSIDLPLEDLTSDDDDAWPVPADIDIDHGLDAPDLTDEDEDEIESLLDGQSPEAAPAKLRTPPPVEDEPESVEGGEARRARTRYRSALENQFLPWVNRQLNPADAAELIPALQAELVSGQAARNVVGILSWACVTGQLIEQSLAIAREPRPDSSYLRGRTYMRFVAPEDGAWKPTPEQAVFLRPHATHVPLDLPIAIGDWLEDVFPSDSQGPLSAALRVTAQSAVTSIREWLMQLRSSKGGQQTIGRVQWWLPTAMYQAHADHVPPHLLCAVNDGLPCPSAYYRAYEINELSLLHRETLTRAGWILPLERAPAAEAWVGSQLNPQSKVVKQLWDRVTCHFEALVLDQTLPIYKRHNARELHESLSQMFQTFHRVVSDPMESLEHIDIEGRSILLDDKSQGEARAHRQIPLTALAAKQCQEQVDHIRRLSVAIATDAPETAQQLLAIVNNPEWRAAPFRFLLNERLEIVRLTPKALQAELQHQWVLPLNLARHFGSTWLLSYRDTEGNRPSDAALSSFLGHHDLGTQNLSLLSPVEFDALFGTLANGLEALVRELGMRSIPTFLPSFDANEQNMTNGQNRKRLSSMMFGHQRRERARSRRRTVLQDEAEQRIRDRLGGKTGESLTQDDVDALFEQVRKASPNRRSYWASERFEAMRAAIVNVIAQFEDMRLDLPAIALSVKDSEHICNMDGLKAARWLRELRAVLKEERVELFHAWRRAKTTAQPLPPAMAVLDLIVDSLVIDPLAWSTWLSGDRRIEAFFDEESRAWIRMPLPAKNSRLYPVRRDLAEHLMGIEHEAWMGFEVESVAELALSLSYRSSGEPGSLDFWQLLNRVQNANAGCMPGLVLGYADGSHAGVSPERMCLERQAGLPPTVAAVAEWEAERPPSNSVERQFPTAGTASIEGKGTLTRVGDFRRQVSTILQKMERLPIKPRAGTTRKRRSNGQSQAADGPSSEAHNLAAVPSSTGEAAAVEEPKKPVGRQPGPMTRVVKAFEEHWADLVKSPQLPPACGLAAAWIHHMAKDGQAGNIAYAPKTIRNYWYSWALRFIEEFGPIHPRTVTPAECEEIYLQIVEDAVVNNRQHLYAPMRNFHRYLVLNHGVPEIEWSQIRAVTGQGLTHIDANIIHQHEYLKALELLRKDEAASVRVRVMQAAVLILLYRFGLRISECLGLQSRDVQFDAEKSTWLVRVRTNQYRGLKTFNARRSVVGLEPLSELEEEVLAAWAAHVGTFIVGTDVRPLFSASATGEQRAALFPRRVIALRIGQALRVASGDPSVRVHHCRHSYATRILLNGIGQFPSNNSDLKACADESTLTLRLREVLTGETHATRRLIWAIAVQLGHGSPLTTLETYSHGGHLLLHDWCAAELWIDPTDIDRAEWIAWSTGTALRTMQRDFQRNGFQQPDQRLSRALGQWSRLPGIGQGTRAALIDSLPDLRQYEGPNFLVNVDMIIDHARRFGRADGLAERLFVSEQWVESVLLAANAFAARHRSESTPKDQWWVESEDVNYPEHEATAIECALEALQGLQPAELAKHCHSVDSFFVPMDRMVVVEAEETLTSAAVLAKALVDDPQVVELLIPAKLPKRLTQAERERRDNLARRMAELKGEPFRPTKPHINYVNGIDFSGSERLIQHAADLGISVAIHGRTSGARKGSHNWKRASARMAMRIRENGYDRIRSAKVFARVLASAIVACDAEMILKSTDQS